MKKDKIYNCYKRHILSIASAKYPNIRKRKYSLKYYLDNFIHVLNDLTKWKALQLISLPDNINHDRKKYHWKVIYNEFLKWSKDGIFELSYIDFLKHNYFKLTKVRKNKKLNMFVDVTKINNKLGSEMIGLNVEYKKKNVTCLSVVCDEDKIPLGVSCLNTNLNKTKSGKHTFVHELNGLQKTLDTIPIDVKPYISVNLMGDKAYISKREYKVFGKAIKVIAPTRKNQKKKNTTREKKLLAKRHKVENFFAHLKRKDRVSLRKDRTIGCYMSFVYLSLMENILNVANKLNVTVK